MTDEVELEVNYQALHNPVTDTIELTVTAPGLSASIAVSRREGPREEGLAVIAPVLAALPEVISDLVAQTAAAVAAEMEGSSDE